MRWLMALALSLTVALGVSEGPVAQAAAPTQAAADTLALITQDPLPRLPLAPGVSAPVSFTLSVTLNSADSVTAQVVGFAEGQGDPLSLTTQVSVPKGTSRVTVSGTLAVAADVRWLTVNAVLGPVAQPLAQVTLSPYLFMHAVNGPRAIVYYSPGLTPEVAQAYLTAYDAVWQKVRDDLGFATEGAYEIFLAATVDVFEQSLIAFASESPTYAALLKTQAGAVELGGRDAMIFNDALQLGINVNLVDMGHEYTHNFYPGSRWYGEGVANLLGLRVGMTVSAARCQVDERMIRLWRHALNGIREGKYLALATISTPQQWRANVSDPAAWARQYGEGYTAVEHWQRRFGFSSVAQLLKHPKGKSDFAVAFREVTGWGLDRFESDYLAVMRAHVDKPPPPIQVTIHLEASGVTPQTRIFFDTYYSDGKGFLTPTGLAPGDYRFEIAGDGGVRSTDGKTTLNPFSLTFTEARRGQVFALIYRPSYRGQTGEEGREVLAMTAIHGRAGLARRQFEVNHPAGTTTTIAQLLEEAGEADASHPVQVPPGDCLAPWPDGNRISATIPPFDVAPTLVSPAQGSLLSTLGSTLSWSLPPGTTQYQVQVNPANNDGPGINLIRNAETSFTIQPPVMGQGNYVMLPGMTYSWWVRATSKSTFAPQDDPFWGPWSPIWTFRTPPPNSATIGPVSPANGTTLSSITPVALQWSNTATDIFYCEVQVSPDPNFGEQGAVAAVWHNLVHGGVTNPLNSWLTPQLQSASTYHWRVRPRVQGDGTPVAWSTTWSFRSP